MYLVAPNDDHDLWPEAEGNDRTILVYPLRKVLRLATGSPVSNALSEAGARRTFPLGGHFQTASGQEGQEGEADDFLP